MNILRRARRGSADWQFEEGRAMPAFSEALNEFFLEGGIFADLIKDGTKSVLAGGVLAALNIVFKERREAQRIRQVEAYALLVDIRNRALAEGSESVGLIPLDYISDRIRRFEESSSLKAIIQRRQSAEQGSGKPGAPHSKLDTVFAVVAPGLPLLLAAIGIVITSLSYAKGTPLAITAALVTLDIWALRRIRSWTARSLENAFVRHASQLLIGLAVSIVGVLLCFVAVGPWLK
jgi:hypothetical protein